MNEECVGCRMCFLMTAPSVPAKKIADDIAPGFSFDGFTAQSVGVEESDDNSTMTFQLACRNRWEINPATSASEFLWFGRFLRSRVDGIFDPHSLLSLFGRHFQQKS